MFDEKYRHALQPFSWQHLVALAVVITIILAIFFSRKFFMKHRVADRILRYTIVFLMIFFEMFPHFYNNSTSLVFNKFITPYPLCGLMLWLCGIAFLSDNAKLEKLLYPLALLGSTMSLLVLDMNYTFPHFNAFQFFFTHGGFLTGSLYFVFTKKISRYTLKDLGNSCLFLFGLSGLTLSQTYLRGDATDKYFILTPPKELMATKNALGQVGYSLVYMLMVTTILFIIYGITYACTKHRDANDIWEPEFKDNKALNYLSKLSNKTLLTIIGCTFVSAIYNTVFYRETNSKFFVVLDIIFVITLIAMFVLLGVISNYRKYHLNKVAVENVKEIETVNKEENANEVVEEVHEEQKLDNKN